MLRPPDIQVPQYKVATAPLLGYEEQLYVNTGQFTDLGIVTVVGVNSGTYQASVPDNAQLSAVPQELLLICESVNVFGDSPFTVQVIGTDASNNPLSGVATYAPPSYALNQGYDFPQHRGVEVTQWQGGVLAPTALFKTITSVVPIAASPAYLNAQFRLVGVPSISNFTNYTKIGTKVDINYDLKIQEPVAIQDGKDMGAYIKAGTIPVGSLDITVKDPVSSDGLRRYNGSAVTGVLRERKGDILDTQYTYFLGLIMTAKPRGQEGAEAVTLQATGMVTRVACVLAKGATQ